MVAPLVSVNPMQVTNAGGLIQTQSEGLIQGTAYDSPNARYNLASGVIAVSETLPMYGGVGIFEKVPPSPGYSVLGGTIGRALNLAAVTGFCVFDQAYNGLTSPQSPVPVYGSGMTANFYRLGSGARVALAINAAFAVTLEGGSIAAQVSWDYIAQEIVPYAPAYNAVTISGFTWASTGGGQVSFTVGTDLTAVLSAGDVIDVSGIVVTGSPTQSINGNWTVVSVPDSTHVVVAAPAGSNPFGTYSSGGTIAAGGGALPVKILQVQTSNNRTVSYDPTTGFATWSNNGALAVALL